MSVHEPPHSLDAERAVLGGILRNPESLYVCLGSLKFQPDFFFIGVHRSIFEAMVSLEQKSYPVDVLSVVEVLKETQQPIGLPYLLELLDSCPLTQNIEHYGQIVRKHFFLRRVIKICQDTVSKALGAQGSGAPHAFIEEVEKEFLQISREQDLGEGLLSAKEILIPTLEEIERRIQNGVGITGIPSGFTDLDKMTGGWQKSDLIIIAGRPGMGKTALALNCAMNSVKNSSIKVAIFTLEMSRVQLLERLVASHAHVDSGLMRMGRLDQSDQDKLMQGARFINEVGDRIVIDESPGLTIGELRSRCRRYAREKGLDLIVVDYLQLMSGSPSSRKQGREREISEISMGLKALAKELHIPILAAAQLNRGPDARPDKRPRMSDLRESGSMEQDADQVLFVYRDDYYHPHSEDAGKAEVIFAKNRHGETGTIHLAWLPRFVTFHNLLAQDEPF